ncbi:acyltransferase family protein [Fibrobacter sp.]|uniref:acyltransferase family protein n=1 Tax=Fibrobacter sp. TaxID=35828 RepID=UPI00388E22E1
MPEAARNRIDWIDEFKGLVLLLVCIYHIEQSFANINMGMENLSDFRMSAFFFISGVLFSTRRFPKFKDYCAHKTRVLFFPYVALSLLFLLLDPVVWNFDLVSRAPRMTILSYHPVIHNLKDYIGWNFAKIFIVGKSSIGSGPIWFVFTLYSISLIFYLIQKATRSNKFAIAVIACVCIAIGWNLSKNHIRLPLGIERDLTTLFFFAGGYLSKGFIQKLSQFIAGESAKSTQSSRGTQKMQTVKSTAAMRAIKRKKRKGKFLRIAIVTLMTIGSFVLYALFEIPDPNYSVMNNELGKSFWRFIGSFFFGVWGLIGAFQVLSQLPDLRIIGAIKGILKNISRNALIILSVHWWILLVLRIIFERELDRPGIVYSVFAIVALGTIAAIPLFRCKLYKLIGKEKISVRESLSIK